MAARYRSTTSEDSTTQLFQKLDSRKRKVAQACKHELKKLFDEGGELNLTNLNRQAVKIIQDTPLSIARRRELRKKYITRRTRRGSLLENRRETQRWKNFKAGLSDFSKWFIVWRSPVKRVEGKFGSAVASYFIFLRWLFFLNLFITVILAIFVVVPEIFINQDSLKKLYKIGERTEDECAADYLNSVDKTCKNNGSVVACVENLLVGKGWIEETILFYGSYAPSFSSVNTTTIESLPGLILEYNRPLAYLITAVIYLTLCLIAMIKYATSLLQKNLVLQKKKDPQKFSTLLFTGWDHTIDKLKTAKYRNQNIFFNLQVDLEEELGEIIRRKQHFIQRFSRNGVRVLIHLMVTLCNLSAYLLIYTATQFNLQTEFSSSRIHDVVDWLVEWLPTVTIVLLNNVLNSIFTKVVQYEDYSPSFAVFMTLVRISFLRLASLLVLLFALYTNITCTGGTTDPNCGSCAISGSRIVSCWETEVGQEFYKLTILDLLFTISTVLMWEYPRGYLSRRFTWARPLGNIEFELTTQVLNLVNTQAISWIGSFFCPFLPLITTIKFFIIFYLRKWSLLHNMKPSSREAKAARSGFFFVAMLVATFLLCLIPVTYAVVRVPPSKGCGPFRGLESSWYEITDTLSKTDLPWLVSIYSLIGTAPVAIAVICLLLFALYYQYSQSAISSEVIDHLELQLSLEKKSKHAIKKKIRELRRMKDQRRTNVARTL